MSLNKFVMRGFTTSAGSGQGNWVSSSPESQGSQTFQPNNDGGTNFVMGGGGLSNPSYRKGTSSRHVAGFRDADYEYNPSDVMNGGTGGRREAPSGCFGGGASSGSGGLDGQKGIIFAFILVMALACALVAMTGPSRQKTPRGKNKPNPYGEVYENGRRGQPVWYR